MSCDGEEDQLLTKWTDICLRGMTETIAVQQIECQKRTSGGRGEFGSHQKDPTKEQKCRHCPERKEYRLQYVTKRSQCCILLDRLTERDC